MFQICISLTEHNANFVKTRLFKIKMVTYEICVDPMRKGFYWGGSFYSTISTNSYLYPLVINDF